ncbi:MAG: cytochrome c [Alphaproteobacteria bacterium]|nr:MAG: cytochrome c [Alphaproteobacteria bacterium]
MPKLLTIFTLLFLTTTAFAASEPALTVTMGKAKQSLTASALLASPKTREIEVAKDSAYGKPMHYRAIPLSALLDGAKLSKDEVIEAVATDGFVAMLPLDALLQAKKGGAEAYLAVEPPDARWPALPGKTVSAGPFYIVWLHPEASGIRSEQWPYMVAELRAADSPAKRWKELAVDPKLAAGDPVRAGQALFVTQCMACHKLNGAGSSDLGPDLNRPANPVEYFKVDALKKYIRDPASLRHWPAMQMKGFDSEALSDHEIDLIIAYLKHMAGRKDAKK